MGDWTFWDKAFVVLAVLQFVFVALLAVGIGIILDTLKKGQRRAEPAITRARALVQMGTSLARDTTSEGQAMAARLKAVAGKVRSRVDTTKRIFGELRPKGQATALAAQETREVMAHRAQTLQQLGRRLSRLRQASEAAARAAREA